jgi:hypothetical protein
MLPVVVFAVLETSGRRRAAIGAAVGVAAAEALLAAVQRGGVEPLSASSFVLFALGGGLAWRSGRVLWLKLQPVALGLLWAGVLGLDALRAGGGDPLLLSFLADDVRWNEAIPPYQRGYFAGYATMLAGSLPFLLVLHAACTAWAAVALSTWWWVAVRIAGFYGAVLALFLVEQLLRVSR